MREFAKFVVVFILGLMFIGSLLRLLLMLAGGKEFGYWPAAFCALQSAVIGAVWWFL